MQKNRVARVPGTSAVEPYGREALNHFMVYYAEAERGFPSITLLLCPTGAES